MEVCDDVVKVCDDVVKLVDNVSGTQSDLKKYSHLKV